MTNRIQRSPAKLRDVLYELSVAKELPDAELLEEFARRYPEHAEALTQFAIDVVVESFGSDVAVEPVDSTQVSPVVARAMSRFQSALHAVRHRHEGVAESDSVTETAAEDPFASLGREQFRSLARGLDVTTVLLCKLRDRQIVARTIRPTFLRSLADRMNVGLDMLAAYLNAGPPRLAAQFYKASQKPEATAQQSFDDAVRTSGLSEDQQRRLLEQ